MNCCRACWKDMHSQRALELVHSRFVCWERHCSSLRRCIIKCSIKHTVLAFRLLTKQLDLIQDRPRTDARSIQGRSRIDTHPVQDRSDATPGSMQGSMMDTKADPGSIQGRSRIDPRPIQDRPNPNPGSIQGRSKITRSRVDPGSIQGRTWIHPGPIQDHTEANPGSIQGRSIIDPRPIQGRSCKCCRFRAMLVITCS